MEYRRAPEGPAETIHALDARGRRSYISKTMETHSAIAALAALAQETRLRAFRLLVCAGDEGLPAGRLAEALTVPPATLSFHLKELTRAGLVEPHRHGRSIRYALRVEGMQEFLRFLSDDCCQGRPELCLPQIAPRARTRKAGRDNSFSEDSRSRRKPRREVLK
jgi:DNA-binding transcriptional ArsR family regulator